MSSAGDALKRELESYVRDGIRRRYETIEKRRSGFDGECEPCYSMHGGRWDVPFDQFSDKVTAGVLQVAASEREADALLDLVFSDVKIIPGETGGDHHTGYFRDYDASTMNAIALAQNPNELRRLLNVAEPFQ